MNLSEARSRLYRSRFLRVEAHFAGKFEMDELLHNSVLLQNQNYSKLILSLNKMFGNIDICFQKGAKGFFAKFICFSAYFD